MSSESGFYPEAFTDKYEIIECLSDTEQGETLLVSDKADDAYCVAKRMTGETDTETELLRKLSHPSLPRYIESFRADGAHILIREYVRGMPLDEYMRERPLSDKQVVDIGIQLCDVLTYLHMQTPPTIHRDVKPQNVIVGENGKVTLIDFGIARTYKQNAKKIPSFPAQTILHRPSNTVLHKQTRAPMFSHSECS